MTASMLITSRPIKSDREILDDVAGGLDLPRIAPQHRCSQLAVAADVLGYGDRITTKAIRRYLVAKGLG